MVLVVVGFLFIQVAMPIVAVAASGVVGDSDFVGPPAPSTIKNPLKVNSIQELISEVLKFTVNLLAIAGVLYIIWAGLKLVAAQGNDAKITEAKKSFMNAIIGMAIILGAWAIATAIANTINKVTQNNNASLST